VSERQNLRKRVSCSSCGRSIDRRHGLVPLGWQEMSGVGGATVVLCHDCVRRNLWLIEARLEIDPASDQ
jgi:hypothetical protein